MVNSACKSRYTGSLLLCLLGALQCFAGGAAAQSLSAADVAVVNAWPALVFDAPLAVAAAPGDTQHLYVLTQKGRILLVDRDEAADTSSVFLDISDRVSQSGGEQGLLGLAFDPAYADNGYFYVNYIARTGTRRTVVARFERASDPLEGDPDSEQILLEYDQPYSNHNGGWIGFGPDRQLYIASGDGGSGGDPQNFGQRLDTVLGKVLRIASDGAIPQDNPFVGTSGARRDLGLWFAQPVSHVLRYGDRTAVGR